MCLKSHKHASRSIFLPLCFQITREVLWISTNVLIGSILRHLRGEGFNPKTDCRLITLRIHY